VCFLKRNWSARKKKGGIKFRKKKEFNYPILSYRGKKKE